jgi:hypothetical protein
MSHFFTAKHEQTPVGARSLWGKDWRKLYPGVSRLRGCQVLHSPQKPQGTDADRDGKAARAVDQRERSGSFRTPAAHYPGKELDSVFKDHRAAALSCLGIDIKEVANIRGVVIAGKTPKDETQNRQLRSGFPGDLERYTYDASRGRDPHHAVMCASAPPPGDTPGGPT